ncbi:MAG: galactokinase [Phycisphaerales bacterium]|nr:galactokinase [Phycisphaerales bacterium]
MRQPDGLVAAAAAGFEEAFGRPWRWGGLAPGRVNLIGEHTDYNEGFVFPMAIDRWCVCLAAPAAGADSRVVARDLGASVAFSLAGLRMQGPAQRSGLPAWARYVAGAMIERAEGLGLAEVPELDVLITASVPRGGGLSSSAAIETASAVVMEAAAGIEGSPKERAIDCQRAEHRWAGVPCGLMDQLASSCGVEGHALLIDCRDQSVAPTPLPAEQRAVVIVIDSGVHHELASGEYASRRAACESAARKLGVSALRDLATHDDVAWGGLSGDEVLCVRHVVSENARVLRAAAALRAGDLDRFGRLMLDSHVSLRDDYRVSCRELDAIVEITGAIPGVYGARMTGGGFGGCAVVLATPSAAEKVTGTVPGAYRARTGIECRVERVAAVGGAGVSRPGPR